MDILCETVLDYTLPITICLFQFILITIVLLLSKKEGTFILKFIYAYIVICSSFIFYFYPCVDYIGGFPINNNIFVPFQAISNGTLTIVELLIHGILFLLVGIGISLCASAKKTYIKYISGVAYIVIFNLSHYYWNYKNGLKVGFIEKPFYIDEIIVEIISILLGISLCLILKRNKKKEVSVNG